MANIVINEISQNYTYNIGANSFATVALPITACWGPGWNMTYEELREIDDEQAVLEGLSWQRFPATQAGLESFVATFRGPVSHYRAVDDYSYQAAMTLLTAGYDVLVAKISTGNKAASEGLKADVYTLLTEEPADWEDTYSTYYEVDENGNYVTLSSLKAWEANKFFSKSDTQATIGVKAKYSGTFGNNIKVVLQDKGRVGSDGKKINPLWNMIVYIVDPSGTQIAAENLTFVFDLTNASETKLHVSEVESSFITIEPGSMTDDNVLPDSSIATVLTNGTDFDNSATTKAAASAIWASFAFNRFNLDTADSNQYIDAGSEYLQGATDVTLINMLADRELIYSVALYFYDALKDRMSYSPNRVICAWDDQNIKFFDPDFSDNMTTISPIHKKLMEVGYYARCATPLIDVPRSLSRQYVSVPNPTQDTPSQTGYAQKLGRYIPDNAAFDVDMNLYQSHSALFAPWGQYTYVGTSKPHTASPSFLALLIQRAMILNQSAQYEWALPSNRRQNVNIGKLDYAVSKKYLDIWQPSPAEGVCVNAITYIPEIGTTIWGNSTLFEIPPATYQALQNLSTRYLYNAVKDIVFRCGTAITFTYNNDQAYSAFYAGVTPTLDTMKNVGAITGYRVEMSADIRGEDQVNANTIIGKIYLAINGVVNDIIVDLIALPPNVDLAQLA